MTPIAVLFRCLAKWRWTFDMEKFDDIFDARKAQSQSKARTPISPPTILKAIIADYKKLVQKETKKPFPAGCA